MAVLTARQLTDLRRALVAEHYPNGVPHLRAVFDAALQAVEDTFESAALQNSLSTAINSATDPVVLTAAEKRALVKFWLRSRFERGN